MKNRTLIFSAPSGSGKSTIVNHLLPLYPELEFSISATSRPPRGTEEDGREYYFIETERFRRLIAEDRFVEYEEVYEGRFYGTLKSEVERIWSKGHVIVFDVDVKGGVNLKKYFGDRALSVFIQAPSVETLRERLLERGTDSPEEIQRRVAKAEEEMAYADRFDYILVNDDLETAFREMESLAETFLRGEGPGKRPGGGNPDDGPDSRPQPDEPDGPDSRPRPDEPDSPDSRPQPDEPDSPDSRPRPDEPDSPDSPPQSDEPDSPDSCPQSGEPKRGLKP